MTQPSTRRHVGLATLTLVAMTAAACGHSSPVAPEAAMPNDAAATPQATLSKPGSSNAGSTEARFPLSAGSFTLSGRKGGQIYGVYSGETVQLNGVSVTTLKLEVKGGEGALAGASGVLDGKGTGAFIGEGTFALEVSGFVSTFRKKNVKFSAALAGSSEISCADTHLIVSLRTSPNVEPALHHQVGNAGCF
jgi:hypothetical protein